MWASNPAEIIWKLCVEPRVSGYEARMLTFVQCDPPPLALQFFNWHCRVLMPPYEIILVESETFFLSLIRAVVQRFTFDKAFVKYYELIERNWEDKEIQLRRRE